MEKICVNPIDRFIIWSEISISDDERSYIYRSRYDGSNKTSLVNDNIIFPHSMAFDFTIKRIYWFDIDIYELYSIDYNGNDRKVTYTIRNNYLDYRNMDLYSGLIIGLTDVGLMT